MLTVGILFHLSSRPLKSFLEFLRLQFPVQYFDQIIDFLICQISLKSKQRIQRNAKQARNRCKHRDIRQRIAILPLVDRRGCNPKPVCHLLLGHVLTLSVFSDHLSNLHILSSSVCLSYHSLPVGSVSDADPLIRCDRFIIAEGDCLYN